MKLHDGIASCFVAGFVPEFLSLKPCGVLVPLYLVEGSVVRGTRVMTSPTFVCAVHSILSVLKLS